MAQGTSIEWTDATWNPVTGCSKISAGCQFCYAERMALRLQTMGQARYTNGFAVTLHPDLLDAPKRWRSPRRIFVNSMSDLFHESVPLSFVKHVFQTISDCPQHIFQILTKRSQRLREFASELRWPENLWMGVSVEDAQAVFRIDDLVHIPAALRFLSCEPLIGPLDSLPLRGIDWVIVGGESGPGARPMERSWVIEILQACRQAGVPFFFKQWGGTNKKRAGRILDGRTWDEMPESTAREASSCKLTSAYLR